MANTANLGERKGGGDDGPSLVDIPDIDWSFSRPVEKQPEAAAETRAPGLSGKKKETPQAPVVGGDVGVVEEMAMDDIDSMLMELGDL